MKQTILNLGLAEVYAVLFTAVKDFTEKEISLVTREINHNKTFTEDLIKKMGELGFLEP